MTPKQRIKQVLDMHGLGLPDAAVSDLVMSIDNAVVTERERCATLIEHEDTLAIMLDDGSPLDETSAVAVQRHGAERIRNQEPGIRASPMSVKIRKPIDDVERDFAMDDDRWFNERDYPEEYVGSSTEDVLIADVGGVRCVIKIGAPGSSGLVKKVRDAILAAQH